MKKQDFLHYLDERLEQIADYDIALDWDTKNHSIEIVVRLFAENIGGSTIDDAQGVTSEEAVIEFEDGILLVDPQKSHYDAEDYLAVLPFEGKKGLSKAFIKGLVAYLEVVLTQGMDDLLDFLTAESEDAVFELHWSAADLQAQVVRYQSEVTDYLPYPSY